MAPSCKPLSYMPQRIMGSFHSPSQPQSLCMTSYNLPKTLSSERFVSLYSQPRLLVYSDVTSFFLQSNFTCEGHAAYREALHLRMHLCIGWMHLIEVSAALFGFVCFHSLLNSADESVAEEVRAMLKSILPKLQKIQNCVAVEILLKKLA